MGVMCQILLNKPREGVHRAGKQVSGVVKYAVDEPTDYSDVILSLIGEGMCSWTETESFNDEVRATTYTGEEIYVKRHLYVLDKLPGETIVLPFGTYEFPFTFILPRNIPPSFSDSRCSISYQVRVLFARPGFFSRNRNFYVNLPVYGYVDHPFPSTPTVFGVDKVLFKPLASKQQEVNLKGEVSKACFSPGENAELSFVVTNNTDIVVSSVITELVCKTTYKANCGRLKYDTRKVKGCAAWTPGVPSQSVAKLSSILPILPELYSIQHSSVLSKEFKFVVTMRLPMPHTNVSVSVPIVIGERENTENCLEVLEMPTDEPPTYKEAIADTRVNHSALKHESCFTPL